MFFALLTPCVGRWPLLSFPKCAKCVKCVITHLFAQTICNHTFFTNAHFNAKCVFYSHILHTYIFCTFTLLTHLHFLRVYATCVNTHWYTFDTFTFLTHLRKMCTIAYLHFQRISHFVSILHLTMQFPLLRMLFPRARWFCQHCFQCTSREMCNCACFAWRASIYITCLARFILSTFSTGHYSKV